MIEREWLAFGHKFADRCGHATGSDDQNERCPVFLQWLDCVHQLLHQFPCAFEFSHTYLVKLVHHAYSNLFGTFLCNTKQERMERVNDNTFSVWGFLNSSRFKNHLYANGLNYVLWPQCNVRDLQLWSDVYLGILETDGTSCPGPPDTITNHNQHNNMTKTRSYGDLKDAFDTCPSQFRRCSDPSITLNGELMDEIDCKSDCIYKNNTPPPPPPPPIDDVIFGKTDVVVKDLTAVTNGFESICLKTTKNDIINHNGNGKQQDDVDSDTECTEPSETTVKSTETVHYERSVETSTETLVSENVLCG